MKEQTLIDLGFERQDVSAEESGEGEYYYYVLDIGDTCLITSANDENEGTDDWSCGLYNSMGLEISDESDLKTLVSILQKNTNKK